MHSIGNYYAVHDVGVPHAIRRSGIGLALMSAVLGMLSPSNSNYLQCEDGWMQSFYAQAGWQPVHRRIGFVDAT